MSTDDIDHSNKIPNSFHEAQGMGLIPWTDPVYDTRDFNVYKDKFPVTKDHALIVPKKNTNEEILKCMNFALSMGSDNVRSDENDITGFNIGMNFGESAGQTVMWPHVHLIFRRDGDTPDPVGGIRNVIPGQGNYRKETYKDASKDS